MQGVSRVNVTLVIQARMGSTRLPSKALRQLNFKPLFECVFRQVKASKVHQVVLSTSDSSSEKPLIELAQSLNAPVFTGPVDDIITRLNTCLVETKATHLVRVWGDCPFVCPDVIDEMVEYLVSKKLAFLTNADLASRTFPPGLDVEIYTAPLLVNMHQLVSKPAEREFPIEFVKSSQLPWEVFQTTRLLPGAHLTIDYEEDLNAAEKLRELLTVDGPAFTYDQLVKIALKNSHLLALFASADRNIEYKKLLKEKELK